MQYPGRESRQSRVLWRNLSFRLVLSWAVYSILFLVVASAVNATVVRDLANDIADNTSDWIICNFKDYPIDEVLSRLNLELIGYGTDSDQQSETDEDQYRVSKNEARSAVEDGYIEASVLIDSSESVSDVYTPVRPIEERMDPSSDDGVSTLRRRYADSDNIAADGTDLSSVRLLVSSNGGSPVFTTLKNMQVDAILDTFNIVGELDEGWQVIIRDDFIALRDLSVYNAIRSLKWPAVICLYLIGCVLIVIAGYGRAMKYFGQLESAVAALLAKKEQPIKLPRALAITENELNSIRLSALSDERAAKAAEHRKDELVAYLAHDIKTPLTSVIGYLDILSEADEMPDGVKKRYTRIALEKAERLELLIDEFFEITRYNLQSIPIERQTIDAVMLSRQVAEEFYPEMASRKMELSIESDGEVLIFADGDKLARVLGNVMRNAVAYADSGSTVRFSVELEGPSDDICVFRIADTGREISQSHLESIFEKFYREDKARPSASGGSGLGLAIAKEIVLAHGGTIEAASQDGETTFAISIPVR